MSGKARTILIIILVLGVVSIWAMFEGLKKVENLSLENYGEFLEKEYPKVDHISTSKLAELIEDSRLQLLLIDCRSPEEYRISHIPGAIQLDTIDQVETYLENLEITPGEIVAYSAVGLRSSKLAKAYNQKGSAPKRIKSVNGSIFAWANQNRPMVNSEGVEVSKVHPYDKLFSRFLEEGKIATPHPLR